MTADENQGKFDRRPWTAATVAADEKSLKACFIMSDAPPVLAIIIVAYRSRDEIGPCLAALPRTLGGRGVEVVVVDNSPGDGTGEIVWRDFSYACYLAPGGNLGFGRANNLGYRHSSGECVLFLNPDTIGNAAALAQAIE